MKKHLFLFVFVCCQAILTSWSGLLFAQLPVNESVLLNNDQGLLPLQHLDTRKIAVFVPDKQNYAAFSDQLNLYTDVDSYLLNTFLLNDPALAQNTKLYNTLVIGIDADTDTDYQLLSKLTQASLTQDVILVLLGSGHALSFFDFVHFPIIWSSKRDEHSLRFAAMTVFGGAAVTRKLDRNYSFRYTKGAGFKTQMNRLGYLDFGAAHADGLIDYDRFRDAVAAIMKQAIAEKATPGAVVLVAKDGQVVFQHAYGFHTYQQSQATQVSDIFDLASITKIVATTPSVMHLVDQHLIDLNQTIGDYLPATRATNKSQLTLKSVMLHEAGFIPFIPFYQHLQTDDMRPDFSLHHAVRVAEHQYIRSEYYERIMWPAMLNSKLSPPGKYVYSDISMYVMKEIIEQVTGTPIDQYVQTTFFQPLGMYSTGFNPRERFAKEQIVPTEYDKTFRKELIQGFVHDQGAAMAGGVAGHAGLFGTVNDLAIFGQLLLNKGSYGGFQYFDSKTVDLFTSSQSLVSRRGLGFDRKDLDPNAAYPAAAASGDTFGHTGFTGTCIWIDPKYNLVYIFLSNRIHPEVSTKLSSLKVRERIFDAVYDAIK